MDKPYSEKELINPSLVLIYGKGNDGLSTEELIPKLRDWLQPKGEDLQVLKGRNDDKFSQKVRNLKSHNTLDNYTYFVDGRYYISDDGVEYLIDNNLLPEDSADIIPEANDIRDQIYDFTEAKNFEAIDDYLSVFDLKRKFDRYIQNAKNNVLILDPSFQREGNVWNIKNKSLLIESVLLNIPIPSIYVYEGENGSLIVIDGRQRLTTIFDFISDKFKLKGLMFLDKLNAKKFSDLDESYRSKIEDKMFHLRKIRYGSDEKFIIETFRRVNTQGINLNAQEIRNALHIGKSTELLNSLSNKIVKFIVPKKRMKDRYLMLRYFAMLNYYKKLLNEDSVVFGSITDYLSKTMQEINNLNSDEILEMEKMFLDAYSRCLVVYGETAAFKLKENLPINMIIFEMSMLFATLLKDKSDVFIRDALQELYTSEKINESEQEETPFEKNIKYHRDAKDNIEQRLIWVKAIVEKY